MQFGAPEVGLFIALLLPFSAMVAAINMLAATYGRSHKEAQTYASYITMVVNFVPILPLILDDAVTPDEFLYYLSIHQAIRMEAPNASACFRHALDTLSATPTEAAGAEAQNLPRLHPAKSAG